MNLLTQNQGSWIEPQMHLLQAQCSGNHLGSRERVRGGPKVKLLISKDTGVCSLPRAQEPLETELRGNDFSVADKPQS